MIGLSLLKGNITDIETDFIVNASNTTLRLGSGISMVLKRACGPVLQEAMDKIREMVYANNMFINQGEVFATSAYELKTSKYVLHAAVIDYNPGVKQFESKPSLQTIKDILENTIPYIIWFENKFKSSPVITFPYMGCGVGGLNKADVRKVFQEFCNQDVPYNAHFILCELKL